MREKIFTGYESLDPKSWFELEINDVTFNQLRLETTGKMFQDFTPNQIQGYVFHANAYYELCNKKKWWEFWK
jgi:hypothetical protein